MKSIDHKSKAHFFIVSHEINPDDICKRLGIKCDESIWKGAINPSGKPELHLLNIVVFRSRLSDSLDMEKHVKDVLTRIMPIHDKIKKLPKNCKATMNCNYMMRRNGGWNFDPSILAALAKLAVPCVFSLDVDTRKVNSTRQP